MSYHLISMTASAVPSACDLSSATHVHSVLTKPASLTYNPLV